ncbi:hypothetical protein BDR04DRAFT_1151791 [Suillus decipiens]|nr:hypothetical protein BDR04DRAFT_1151791 [Suillus decipiens]
MSSPVLANPTDITEFLHFWTHASALSHAMTTPNEPFFMPICTAPSAPYFNVDQLSDKAGISQESWIKYAVRYADPDEADLWKDLDKYTGSSYEDFTNATLQFYPERRPTHYVSTRPLDPKSSDICELIFQDEPVASIAEEVLVNIPSAEPIKCAIIQDNPIVADVAAIPEILDPLGDEIFEVDISSAPMDIIAEYILPPGALGPASTNNDLTTSTIPEISDPIGDELAKAEMLQVTSDIVEDDILTLQNILQSPETVEINEPKISALGYPVTPDHFALFMIFTNMTKTIRSYPDVI